MVILVVFNSFNVVKNLKKPDPVARQMPPLYTTAESLQFILKDHLVIATLPKLNDSGRCEPCGKKPCWVCD